MGVITAMGTLALVLALVLPVWMVCVKLGARDKAKLDAKAKAEDAEWCAAVAAEVEDAERWEKRKSLRESLSMRADAAGDADAAARIRIRMQLPDMQIPDM